MAPIAAWVVVVTCLPFVGRAQPGVPIDRCGTFTPFEGSTYHPLQLEGSDDFEVTVELCADFTGVPQLEITNEGSPLSCPDPSVTCSSQSCTEGFGQSITFTFNDVEGIGIYTISATVGGGGSFGTISVSGCPTTTKTSVTRTSATTSTSTSATTSSTTSATTSATSATTSATSATTTDTSTDTTTATSSRTYTLTTTSTGMDGSSTDAEDESSSTSDESSSTSDESSSTSAETIEVGGCMTLAFSGSNLRALIAAYRQAIAKAANVDVALVEVTATRGSICNRVGDGRRLQENQGDDQVAMVYVIRFPPSMAEAANETRNILDTIPSAEVARLLDEEVSGVDGLGEVTVISDLLTGSVETVPVNEGATAEDDNSTLIIGIVAGVLGVLALCALGVGLYLCAKKQKGGAASRNQQEEAETVLGTEPATGIEGYQGTDIQV